MGFGGEDGSEGAGVVGGLVVRLEGVAGIRLALGGALDAGVDVGLDSGKRGETVVVAVAWGFSGSPDAGFAMEGAEGFAAAAAGGTEGMAGFAGDAVIGLLTVLPVWSGGGVGAVFLEGANSSFGDGDGLAGDGDEGLAATGATGATGFETGATVLGSGVSAGFEGGFGRASARGAVADFFLAAGLGASAGGFATGEAGFGVGATGRAVGRGLGDVGLAAFATLAAFFGSAAPVRLVADLALVDFAGTAEGAGIGGAVALTLDLGAEGGELGLPALFEGLLAEVELRDVVVRFLGTRFFSGFITTGGTGFDA